jgi:predicted HTH domain antitoxin
MTMNTETITLEISQDLLAALKMGAADLAQNIRNLAAIGFYQDKRLSLGKAAQLAGMNRLLFMDLLATKGIVIFDYDQSELATDLEGIEKLSED